MEFIKSILSENYITIMLLIAFALLYRTNRSICGKETKLFTLAMAMTLGIAVLDQIEKWCDMYDKPVWILYVKSALVYAIYPSILLLVALVSLRIKKRFIFVLPLLLNTVLLAINAFGNDIVYGYKADHSYFGGPLNFVPILLMLFYEIVISVSGIRMLKDGIRQRGLVLLFIAAITFMTVLFELINLVIGYTDEICALGLLVYFRYISSEYQENMKDQLYQAKLEAERSKNDYLMAQIQPHFINKSLMAIRARCIKYPEIYENITKFSKYLRTHFDAMNASNLITFENEMDNVEAYLDLERENYGERLRVEYDIECDQFLVPALSVQPLVENAVRHGIGTYDQGGTVHISSRKNNGKIIVEVTDDGSGKSSMTQQQQKRKGIGIENVRSRLRSMRNGELEIISGEHGTTAKIIIDEE